MTQEFKNNILKWLVGKYSTEEQKENTPIYHNLSTKTENFYTELCNTFEGATITDIIETKCQENDLGLMVVYGALPNGDGFICIIDEKGNSKQVITEYTTGSKLRPFITLNVAEDGMFYGIDSDSNNENRRFVLLNNFVLKLPSQDKYEVTLRNSYYIPSASQSYEGTIEGIKKSPNGATYLIYGNTNESYSMPFVTKFVINVGSDNEWTEYTYSNSAISVTVRDLYVSDWENIYFQVGAFDYVISNGNEWYSEYVIDSDTTTMTRDLINRLLENPNSSTYGFGLGNIQIVSEDKVYLTYYIRSSLYYQLFFVSIDRKTSEKKTIIDLLADPVIIGQYVLMKEVQGQIFILVPWWEENASSGSIKMGHVIDDKAYLEDITTLSTQSVTNNKFFVSNSFNLYNYIFLDMVSSNIYSMQEIHNQNNYNSESYNGLNAMKPNSGVLYDNNEIILFARNLYNKTINNNTTLSILEIPNIYLNDVTISKQELLSETNKILNLNSKELNKNIYETLNINFYNTLNMKDKNTQKDAFNLIGASRLNNSVSESIDYNEAKATKYRINFSDNTTQTFSLNDDNVVISENNAIYTFIIYVGKQIKNIEIISNDEKTIYQTIDTTNLEIGKYYKIKQEVEIL